VRWRPTRQTLRNESERARLRAEHPGEDEAVLMRRNRILGGLEPARAFGDAKYKASVDMHRQVLSKIIGPKSMREGYRSPPYVIARPVVSHFRIDPTRDRAMVLATDGLWDKLASADAAALIGMHAREHPIDEANFEDDDRESCDAGPGAGFALADANPCTHLLRNALGGGSHAALLKQVGTVPPHTRKIRDDITSLVVYFTPAATAKKL
jgi:pyruvate dehydrogenase phosphatase